MNIVYFMWGDDKAARRAGKEFGISLLSIEKTNPGSNITVYIAEQDKKHFDFLIPFLNKHNCKSSYLQRDNHRSTFAKVLFFTQAIKDFKKFIYLDNDTMVMDKFSRLPKPKPAYFAPCSGPALFNLTAPQWKFLKKYFDAERKFKHICSYFMYIRQKSEFQKSFQKEMDRIAGDFMKKCNDLPLDDTGFGRESVMKDELYYTLALQRLGVKAKALELSKLRKVIKHKKDIKRARHLKEHYEKQLPFI